jgi:hypothetical protein
MSACWALAWLQSKFDFQKCLLWVLAWANDNGTNCGTLHHAPRKAMFEGNGPLWKCLEWICILRICAWNTRGMEIISFLFCWVCGVVRSRCTRQKTIGWDLSVCQALWQSLLDNLYFVLSLSAFPPEHMSLEVPSPSISRPPPPSPLGTTMSTKDTAVRRAGQQEISSQPPSQAVGRKSASHLLSHVFGIGWGPNIRELLCEHQRRSPRSTQGK